MNASAIGKLTAAVATAVLCGAAQAATVSVFVSSSNDCSGYFGQGFENCTVGGSPIIAKLGAGGGAEINEEMFPSITGDEFSFSGGTWNYNPGAGDPVVRFWVSKNANDFTLFYNVPDENAVACAGSLTEECLSLAQGTTSGSYIVQGLSHLSFYDTGGTVVPLPGTLGLLGLGLAGLGLVRRKKEA